MASLKEELESDDEDTETTSRSKSIRLPEFRRANTIDYLYWKRVEDDLRLEGRKFRTGQFSREENLHLTKNWQTLIKKCTLKEPEILLRTNVCPEMKEYVKEFKTNNNFYVRLGHRINRSPYAVYLRARKMFNIVEKTGKFTTEEENNLKSLETKLGKKWEQIGRVMGRSGHATFKKAEALKKEVVKGRWSKEEDEQLMEAVTNHLKKRKTKTTMSENENRFFKLPWKEISKHVPTRNAKQCRERCLLVHEQNGESDSKPKKEKFKKLDRLKLVEEIRATKVTDECDIDWALIHKQFTWIRCPQLLHYHWYRMKKSVPNYHYNSLKENLDGVIKILSNDLVIGYDSDDDMDFNESTLSELARGGFSTKGAETSPGPFTRNEMSSNVSLTLPSQDVSQIDTPNLNDKSNKKRKRQRSASSDIVEAETSEINESLNDSNTLQLGSDETPIKEKTHKKKKRQSSANSDAMEVEEIQISPEKHSSSELEASGGDRKHKKKKKKTQEISPDPDRADIEKVEQISKSVEQESAEKNLPSTSSEAKTPKKKKRSSKELTPSKETEIPTNKEKVKHKDTDEQESDLSGILDRSLESNVEMSEEFKAAKASKKKKNSLDDIPQSQSENILQEEVPTKEPKRKKRKLSNTPLSMLDDF